MDALKLLILHLVARTLLLVAALVGGMLLLGVLWGLFPTARAMSFVFCQLLPTIALAAWLGTTGYKTVQRK
jgi:hypothetical protein